MAGGKGERFWPLSTGKVPKPFLPLIGSKTLIQLTAERASRFLSKENIFVVLGKTHLHTARKQLPDIPLQNFIVEPIGRDTAACIGLAATVLSLKDRNGTMIVVPADQFVPDMRRFEKTARRCIAIASGGDYLVTIGIKPSRPETGYGYIQADERKKIGRGMECYRVAGFVEKPDRERAARYLAAGDYYWNAGIFVWQTTTILNAFKTYMPSLFEGLEAIRYALINSKKREADRLFIGFERKSIDYGVMEKADNVLMVPADFQWDDVGTWSSLERVFELDKHGNYLHGKTMAIDTRNSVVVGDDRPIGIIGLSNVVVVASKNGILVCEKERVQQVREIAKKMQK